MTFQNFLKDKKVTLMGLGLLGRGIGDARFLSKYVKELIVTDLKSEDELKESVEKLKDLKNIKFILGRHREEDFKHRDMIIKGNGVPLKNQFIEVAEKNHIPIYMSTALFVSFLPSNKKIIGITGTKGKSTVTQMMSFVLENLGETILVGGNTPGLSTLEQLEKVYENHKIKYIILELDSWQLQGFNYQKISPNISLFTNFFEDHLNYYPTMNEYFLDKANIFKYQKNTDKLFIGEKNILDWIQKNKINIKSKIFIIDGNIPLPNFQLKIPGEHNQKNANLVFQVLLEEGFNRREIIKGINVFPGLPGRLELLKDINGVKIWNDNNSTTPDTTALSINTLEENVIWIGGGTDKKLSLSKLVPALKRVKKIFLLSGTGTEKLKTELKKENILFFEYKKFEDMVINALKHSQAGDNILFSPAFSSFGKEFKNEYDREEQFKQIIK